MPKVVIGVDPHKASNTLVVIDAQEHVVAEQRFVNDRVGYRDKRTFARTFPERTWAVEGARGVGAGLAQRLVAEPGAAGRVTSGSDWMHHGTVVRVQDGMREDRRIVTALFADLVGSTQVTEVLDPEDAREVLGAAVKLVIEQVDALEGTVKDLAGDGVLALFGAPTAHEDDAERAVLCGLRITAAVRDLAVDVSRRWQLAMFSVRVGIETGRAVLGPVGAGSHVEYGATGDALNTAARLQSKAEPGTVLVGAATRVMVEERFTWAAERHYALKGKTEPVQATVALGQAPHGREGRGFGGTSLVGRNAQLRQVATAIGDLRGGRGSVVAVVADAGVGKSRLVAEARRATVSDLPLTWLEAAAASYGRSVPLLLFRNTVLGWLELPLTASGGDIQVRIATLSATRPGAVAEALLGLTATLTQSSSHEPDAAAAQERVFALFENLFAGLVRERPVALVLEDLHWCDPTSLALLQRLVPMTAATPLLLLLTTRPDTAGRRVLAGLGEASRDQWTRVDLRPLAREEDRELLRRLLDGAKLPRQLEERLLDTTDGNPFFVEEQVRALAATGAMRGGTGDRRFVGAANLVLPATVERALVARIDRLPERARSVMLAAAVLGVRFDGGLLATVTGSPVGDALTVLEAGDFVVALADAAPPGTVYRFRHALVQEAAYATMLRSQRRQLHGRAAATLARTYAGRENEVAAVLGRHLVESGAAEQGARYLGAAARLAAARYSNEEAATLARQASDQLTGMEPDMPPADRDLLFDLARIEGAALRALARYDEAIDAYRRLIDLLGAENRLESARVRAVIGQLLADAKRYQDALIELEDAGRFIGPRPASVEEFEVWFAILLSTSSVLYWLSDKDRHTAMLREAELIVDEFATPTQRIDFYDAARSAELRRSDFLVSDELARIDQLVFDARQQSPDEQVRSWASFTHGLTLMWRRDLEAAQQHLQDALVHADHLGSVMLRSRTLTYLMITARLRADAPAAAGLVDVVRETAREAGLPEYEAMAAATSAWLALRSGDHDRVRVEASAALAVWKRMENRYPLDWLAALPLLAAAVADGDSAEAAAHAGTVLSPGQQALPERLAGPLRAGVDAAADNDAHRALEHLGTAVAQAIELCYL